VLIDGLPRQRAVQAWEGQEHDDTMAQGCNRRGDGTARVALSTVGPKLRGCLGAGGVRDALRNGMTTVRDAKGSGGKFFDGVLADGVDGGDELGELLG
jgi:hypothetical protein